MADVIFWCGPVVVNAEFKAIDWGGRDVRIVPVAGAGSSNFQNLAGSLRNAEGRILPGLISKYAGGISVDQVVLGAYSAGWGLLNAVAAVDADRAQLSALMLSDACFDGGDPYHPTLDNPKAGYTKAAVDAAGGSLLMVSTTAHTTSGAYLTGKQSWAKVWAAAEAQTGKSPAAITPPDPVPPASGGWHRIGDSLYWGDYDVPGSAPGVGNDFTHEEQHYLAPKIWQAYLSPWLAGERPSSLSGSWPWLVAGAAAGAAAGYAASVLGRR
jgi:hypothetical protein